MVLFGLFHGLVFLPVMLSWIGPSAYALKDNMSQTGNDIAMVQAKEPQLNGQDNEAYNNSPQMVLFWYI